MSLHDPKIEIRAFLKDGCVDLRSARVLVDGEGTRARGVDTIDLSITARSVQATLHCSDKTTITSRNVRIVTTPYEEPSRDDDFGAGSCV